MSYRPDLAPDDGADEEYRETAFPGLVTTPDTSAEVERMSDEDVRAVIDSNRAFSMSLHIVPLLEELLALRALLPSPAAVRQARLVAAEIVDVVLTDHGRRHRTPGVGREAADVAARRIRFRAGWHDASVDERELLVLARRVERCTTMGELEALVAQWREVA